MRNAPAALATDVPRKSREQRELQRLGVDEVPQGWELSTVGAECSIRNELRFPLSVEVRREMAGQYPYYGPTGILDGINEYRIDGEYALIGEDGDHFLDVSSKSQTLRVDGRFNVNNHAHVIAGTDSCTIDWFFFFFQHRDISHSLTRQGAGRFKLTKAALEKLPILLPPVGEQRKIVEILRTWDQAVDKLEALRAAKSQQLEGFAARLIHKAQGKPKHLREHLLEVSERNRNQRVERVLSVTNSAGFVLAEDQFAHRVASADISN
ncbi:MAG TPA: restriction endonuclease subunit S, partial [Pirellulaceae bacterium]|nr:restriction endonuclease subunit S [Pirellulaceae bacterium]